MGNDYGELIKWCDKEIKTIKKSKELFNDEQKLFKFFNDYCFVAYYNQIHNYLAPKDTDESENEIQALVKAVITIYLPVIKAKIDSWKNTASKQKNVERIKSANYFVRLWKEFYEKFFALASFRSLTHFTQFMEWDIKDKDKVFKHSIDPFGDGGWTGVNYPFLFYFNRMVLKKDIKVITKQYPTGYGKTYSDTMAISWLLGKDENNDVLKVLGNPSLVLTTTKGIVDIMTSKRFAMVFPKYLQYHEKDVNPRDMFSICRLKEGEVTLANSKKPINLKVISKDTSIDGIRVRYLFLDDICRSKDAENDREHDKDISNFWNSWWKRNYNTNDFYIIIGGTAYSVNDIVSTLKRWYSKGYYRPSKINKYTKLNEKGDCVFIAIPKLDWDTDESTYPQRFPTEEARQIRERNERSFMAMEQQMPQDPESTPLAWEKINTYRELPSDLSKGAFAVLDPARTGANYVSMPIHRIREEVDKYGAKIEKHYLTDAIFRLSKMEDVYADIIEKIKRHNIVRLHIENNTDTSLAFLLNTKLHEQGITFCVISESFSTENKDQKLKEVVYGNEGCFINNMVYPCFGMFAQSSEVGKFMRNLTSYSYNTKMDFDDGIDSECMYIEKFVAKKRVNNKPKLLKV